MYEEVILPNINEIMRHKATYTLGISRLHT